MRHHWSFFAVWAGTILIPSGAVPDSSYAGAAMSMLGIAMVWAGYYFKR